MLTCISIVILILIFFFKTIIMTNSYVLGCNDINSLHGLYFFVVGQS